MKGFPISTTVVPSDDIKMPMVLSGSVPHLKQGSKRDNFLVVSAVGGSCCKEHGLLGW